MNFVLDASVALAWCFADESGAYSDRVLDELVESEAVVPALWPVEVTNVLAVAMRRKRMRSDDATAARTFLQALPIAVEPFARERTFEATAELANRLGLTTYDACYLELARRRGISLATLDTTLRTAAQAEGVSIY